MIHNNELPNGPECLRNLLIANRHHQFNNKDQMDPDEFMRFLLGLSQSLTDICNMTITYIDTCIVCSEVSQVSNDCVGVHASINDDSIESIIKKDMVTSVEANCTKCKKNTEKHRSETFTSLPEVFMILAKRFMAIQSDQGFRNEKITSAINPSNYIFLNNIKYTIKSVIIHNGFENVSNAGHYTVALRETNVDWIMCDDLRIHKTNPPMNGYIYFL